MTKLRIGHSVTPTPYILKHNEFSVRGIELIDYVKEHHMLRDDIPYEFRWQVDTQLSDSIRSVYDNGQITV